MIMPEDTTSADAQAANADPAQAATSSNAQAATDTEPVSLEDARKLRSEARAMRDRLKAAESSAKELADLKAKLEADKLTETERWQKQATDLQSKYDSDTSALTERIVRYEVERQAAKLGIIDPDAAAQLIDWDALEYDEDGTPKNADALLKDLLKSKPYLAGKVQASAGGATNPSRAQSNASGELSWDVITKMTAEQYNARRAEIQQWMMRNPMRRI
jgi:hypothetical protein